MSLGSQTAQRESIYWQRRHCSNILYVNPRTLEQAKLIVMIIMSYLAPACAGLDPAVPSSLQTWQYFPADMNLIPGFPRTKQQRG